MSDCDNYCDNILATKENFDMREELLKGLTEEQIAKAKECQSPEELLNFAKEEGIELSEEQLEAVSGGGCFENSEPVICPKCGSVNDYICIRNVGNGPAEKTCNQCGYSGLFW